ncbi:MAG TPA: serine/threonine-protein kinase, partial [Gemmataceae bacterium]|nr:serine/threonine-protein kinase [Gemmataceae bacterium]
MAYTVQNLCGFLIRSRLLSADEVRALYQRWRSEAGDTAAQTAQFLKWLVARRYVTEYQASLLGRGLPDNFFLNEYKILDRIGQGSMAGVYRAVHPLGQEVAIKVLPPSRAKNPRVLARFQREARLALRLKHPNVVRAFHVGEASGLHYIVMEYLEGETLDDVVTRRTKVPPDEAVRLVCQVLAGLQHIHEQGLIHRDLKPSNLMLVPARAPGAPDTTAQATVKILDIGLGRELFDERLAADSDGEILTSKGTLLGTPNYLAPEQARDAHNVDIRADIYSLGCVLYEVLAGRPP